MTNPVAQLRPWRGEDAGGQPCTGTMLMLWCPGCEDQHAPEVVNQAITHWGFNGSVTAPTIDPSLLVHVFGEADPRKCHSMLIDGVWQFLDDTYHELRGQRVPLVPLPDWLVKR